MGNIVFLDRFNGGLSHWVVSNPSLVTIVTKDFSPKMRLNGNSLTAVHSFAEPGEPWVFECDCMYESGSSIVVELLDSLDNIIAYADLTSNIVTFNTDSPATLRDNVLYPPSIADRLRPNVIVGDITDDYDATNYKEIVFVVNNLSNRIELLVSEDTDNSGVGPTHGGLKSIGVKGYSGDGISKIRFKTQSAGICYVDEVKIYTPNLFIIGDSITDGKIFWSYHPNYSGRLDSNEDETSAPHYRLGLMLGGLTEWVADRAGGGWLLSAANSHFPRNIINEYPKMVVVAAGHNDIINAYTLEQMQAAINSIIAKLQNASLITSSVFVNVFPGSDIDTTTERTLKTDWNTWLETRAAEVGAAYVDMDSVMQKDADPNALKAEYDQGDGVHLSKPGSQVWAKTIFDVMLAAGIVEGSDILRPLDEDIWMYPRGFASTSSSSSSSTSSSTSSSSSSSTSSSTSLSSSSSSSSPLPVRIHLNDLWGSYHIADNKFTVNSVDLWWDNNNLVDFSGIIYILRNNVMVLV
jgi:lysophospholipase L1-like esterase